MYACVCLGLTEAEVRRVGRDGTVTPDALVHALGLDQATCCGRCLLELDNFVELAQEGREAVDAVRVTQYAG
jgi:bacterioferritin-associated ferredoxin